MKEFIKQMLSGSNGVVSSKRIIGAITMLVVLGCTIYFAVNEGCTDQVENIIQTLIISACGLLGITSISNALKNKNPKKFQTIKSEENREKKSIQEQFKEKYLTTPIPYGFFTDLLKKLLNRWC